MSTRSTIIFKLNNTKIATYTQHGDAYRENIKEKVNAINNILFDLKDKLTKSHIMDIIKNVAKANDWDDGAYSWSSYIHEINIDLKNLTISFKTFDTKATSRHSDSGTVEELLKKRFFKNFTAFKEDKNSLSIYKDKELIGYYNESYVNKNGENVYTYSKFVKSKLIDSSIKKISSK